MSDLENRGAERQSRQDAGGVQVASRYSEAITRYLGAVGYGRRRRPPRTAFAGALLGSVSRSLVQRAQCPVLLVG
jgi:nucleotide-binding universal stress UspA family protein